MNRNVPDTASIPDMSAAGTSSNTVERSISLVGATGVGIGAIVGGGILALAGVAYATTGPSAVVAFALNGVIALITALSFAEMSTRFPESGGTYTFAKKVLSVQAAFVVGWVVWFASIVAAVLYALGFAAFAVTAVEQILAATTGEAPAWTAERWFLLALAIGAVGFYSITLLLKADGGGALINVMKLVVFAILLAGALYAFVGMPKTTLKQSLSPFFANGYIGLVQAMGFTFIALQGFDLIAAVAGEVKQPEKNIPRAMLLSLGIALVIYLPLMFLVSVVGVPTSTNITAASQANPETIMASAAGYFLGAFGYWLVIVAGILAMLSALQANLFAASRVAFSMARDRTLPKRVGFIHAARGTPMLAVIVSCTTVALLIVVVPNLAAAGAVASLIFLISFALTHWTTVLARQRGDGLAGVFQFPLAALVPPLGFLACAGLAIFQGIAVPSAGVIAAIWLGMGAILYLTVLAPRARVVDASIEGFDPQLMRMRGRAPVILVPIANPDNAVSMVSVANALVPTGRGRVVLLSVVAKPDEVSPGETPQSLVRAQHVLRESLSASMQHGMNPEALTTIAQHPWQEITRVAEVHRCDGLLVGLGPHQEDVDGQPLERLLGHVDAHVAVLRAPTEWQLADVENILVPVGGRNIHDVFRARMLGTLYRTGDRKVTFLRVMRTSTTEAQKAEAEHELTRMVQDEVQGPFEATVVLSDEVGGTITQYAAESDLVILGINRIHRRKKIFGNIALAIARNTDTAIVILSRRG